MNECLVSSLTIFQHLASGGWKIEFRERGFDDYWVFWILDWVLAERRTSWLPVEKSDFSPKMTGDGFGGGWWVKLFGE